MMDNQKVVFTDHALDRVQERHIPKQVIGELLAQTPNSKLKPNTKTLIRGEVLGVKASIIAIAEKEKIVIITALRKLAGAKENTRIIEV